MPRSDRFCLTVSPPTFDRTEFPGVDRALEAPHAPFARDWLMARFSEGLEIRMLRAPLSGFVVFQPGRLSWRPVEGAERAIVVQDLRVARTPHGKEAARRLWSVVESFARYYGYAAVLAVTGSEDGLIAPDLAPGRFWLELDRGAGDVRLVGRIFQGPMAVPHFPRDWTRRAAAQGRGLVIQTTGESAALEARADRLCAMLGARGIPVRRMRFSNAEEARQRATSPGAVFSVIADGVRLGGPELSDHDVLCHVAGALAD